MVKDIQVGQKFLSNGEVGEIVSTTRKNKRPVVWIGDTTGHIHLFFSNGLDDESQIGPYDLQPSPVVITEGIEFSGEAYRAEFERLVKDGREFDRLGDNSWDHAGSADFSSDHQYRLRPQHRDAAGNPLKVGDRVEYVGRSDAITELTGSMVRLSEMGTTRPGACRKLTTKTRPLCADDLMQHRTALFRISGRLQAFYANAFYEKEIGLSERRVPYRELQADWEWSPCSDQPWQPCEVTEEVLA